MNEFMSHQTLKRELHFWDAVGIGIGIIIGVGIFKVPSTIAKHLHEPTDILFAWVVGGLIALCGAFCYAELASRYPHTGGTYVFLRESYGKFTSFLFGWTEIVILRAGSIAAVAYVFASYLSNFIPMGDFGEKIVAIIAIGILTAINVSGLRQGTTLQNFLSGLKVFNLIAMSAVIVWVVAKTGVLQFKPNEYEHGMSSSGILKFLPAIVPILWTYGGWHESAFMAGEFRDTKKELPRAIITSTIIVMTVYLLINAAYLTILSADEMVKEKAIASACFLKIFGSSGSAIITVAVLISAFGALNSTVMTGGRIPFALAQDHSKLHWIRGIHEEFGTPHSALILNGIWAAVLVVFGTFEQLLYFCQFAQWLFFGLAGVSIFIARKKGKSQPHFSMFGYPYIPVMFIAIAISVCASIIWYTPKESFIGALLILSGIPIYYGFGLADKK